MTTIPDHRRVLMNEGRTMLLVRACFIAPKSGTRLIEENHATLATGAEPTMELVDRLADELEARAKATAQLLGLSDLRPMTDKETKEFGWLDS
jgi:hypothetical protein